MRPFGPVLVAIAGVGLLAAPPHVTAKPPSCQIPDVTVDPGSDWGSAEFSDNISDIYRTFVITNNSGSSITISGWTPWSDGTVTATGADSGPPLVLGAHSSIDPGVTFDTGNAGAGVIGFSVFSAGCVKMGTIDVTVLN